MQTIFESQTVKNQKTNQWIHLVEKSALQLLFKDSVIWLVYTFKSSKEQGQEPIILENLTTVAKLLSLLNAVKDLSKREQLHVRERLRFRNHNSESYRDFLCHIKAMSILFSIRSIAHSRKYSKKKRAVKVVKFITSTVEAVTWFTLRTIRIMETHGTL